MSVRPASHAVRVLAGLLVASAFAACAPTPGPASRTAAAGTTLAATAALAESSDAAVARGDAAEALRLDALRFQRLAAVLPPEDPEAVMALARLGASHHRAGMHGLAEVELQAARVLADRPSLRGTRVASQVLHELGLLAKDTGRPELAHRLVHRAWDDLRARPGDAPVLAASVCRTLGNWELRWGTVDRALEWYRRSLEIARAHASRSPATVAEAETWLGFAYLRAARHDDAERHFRAALALLPPRDGRDRPEARSALDLLAVVEFVRGRVAESDSLLRRSTRLADEVAARQPAGFGVGVLHPSLRLGLADVLLHEGRGDEAWEVAQVWAGWVTDQLALGHPAVPDTGGARRMREVEARFEREGPPRTPSALAARIAALADLAGLEARRLETATGRRDERAGGPARAPVQPRLQRSLAADEAFVGWLDVHWDDDRDRGGSHTLWAYVVRANGPVRWVRLRQWSREADWLAWVAQLDECERRIEAAAAWPVRVAPEPTLDTLETRLGSALLGPLATALTGARRLIVVYQVLHRWVPIECLRLPGGPDVLDRYEVSYTPSARMFVAVRERAAAVHGARRGALVVGDPWYAGRTAVAGRDEVPADWTHSSGSVLSSTTVRGVLSGELEVSSLPRLPHSRAEARAVAADYPGATLLLGAGATESALEALRRSGTLSRFATLHFATHALVDDAFPERSAVALAPGPEPRRGDAAGEAVGSPGADADGLLRASDILERWRLGADLVVLSSCQTASGRFTWSAQALGLPQSLLGAGARSLLLSPWKVDDLATRALMESFHASLTGHEPTPSVVTPAGESRAGRDGPSGPVSRGAALRDAKRRVRDFVAPDGSRPFAHPAYWAGFILIGDPGTYGVSHSGR